MSRRRLSVLLVVGCAATALGVLAYSASGVVPTSKIFANLNGAQEAPGPGDANAAGAALVTVKPATDEVCINIRFNQIDGTPNAMHIHRGTVGNAGPIVINLSAALSNKGTTCTATTGAIISQIRNDPGAFYCNVHSSPNFTGGAIRGQLSDSDIG